MAGDRIDTDTVMTPAAENTFSSYVTADNEEKKATHIVEDAI